MKRFVLAMLALLFCSIAAFAQTNTTTLSGTVTDNTGAVIPGVTITITNKATGNTLTAVTKNDGNFAFEQLQPGTYDVKVASPGFSEAHETVDVLVATPKKVAYKLTAGASDIVNVETNLAEVNTSDATLGKSFNSSQVANLPYLANNVTYLLSLQPGVLALDSGGATGGLNTDTRTGIVNGARQDQTNITLDGVDNNDQIFGFAFNGALRSTRDSVEEFRVTTTNANADAGRSSGAQVSLVTKSGTNTIHGSAYEYYRDPGTTANNWFIKQAQLASNEPNIAAKVLQHTYGASLGVPLLKDKLFFFGAYEGFKQASDIAVGRTVPSAFGSKAGAVLGLASGNVTYVAANGLPKTLTPSEIATLDGRSSDSACKTTACVAPSTNTAAVAYFNTFPLSNAPGAADSYNTGNYNFASPAPIHQITNIARLDYILSAKQSVFARGNLQSDNQASTLQFPGLPAASTIYGNSKGVAIGHIWNINDRMTNNARYGLVVIGNASRGTGSQPFVSFGAFDTLTASTTSTVYKVTTNNISDDFTLVRGRHTIQVGGNIYFVSNAQYFDAPLLSQASIRPDLLATAAIAGQGGTLDPGAFNCADCAPVDGGFANLYNDAITANVGAIERATSGTEFKVAGNTLTPLGTGVVPTHTFRNLEQEYYLQDQWKATPRLTLTAGLRYVYLGVPTEKDGQQIAPTIPLNEFLADREQAAAAGTGYTTDISFRASGSKNGQPGFWTAQKLNFAPRFAFAYSTPDNRTSIRGGFAVAFDHFGSGLIDAYQSSSSSLLSLGQTNQATYQDINSNPRFTGYHDVPAVAGASGALALPYTPAENSFTFLNSINDNQKTPYAETFNLTVQHEFAHNLSVTASYVGRLGRHVTQGLDVAMPTNLADSQSGQTYFQAAQNFDKMADAGVDPSIVPDSGYFHNVFPNLTYLDAGTGKTYTGAQAYYDVFANNRGNETNALYAADCAPQASCNTITGLSNSGASWRFFYPQTSSIYAQSTTGSSNYNALQLSMRQAIKFGLEYDVNYTYAKSMDEGSDPERTGAGGSPIVNSFFPHQWYAPSDYDVRHNITANYTAPLPFGRHGLFLNNGDLMDRLVGGFQLNGVVHYSTGFPFSAVARYTYGTNFANESNMVQIGTIPTGGHHYDAANQEETALNGITSKQATANLRFAYVGESGQRNNFRADGYLSLDDGLSKSIRVWGEHELRLSAEVFNILNTNRFATPQTDGTSAASFGVYQNGPGQSNTQLQTSTSSLLVQPRQMQFSGKFIF